MELNVERQGGTLIAKAAGRIDGVNASDFEQSLSGAIDDSDPGYRRGRGLGWSFLHQ